MSTFVSRSATAAHLKYFWLEFQSQILWITYLGKEIHLDLLPIIIEMLDDDYLPGKPFRVGIAVRAMEDSRKYSEQVQGKILIWYKSKLSSHMMPPETCRTPTDRIPPKSQIVMERRRAWKTATKTLILHVDTFFTSKGFV